MSNRVYQALIGRDEVAALRLGEREVERIVDWKRELLGESLNAISG